MTLNAPQKESHTVLVAEDDVVFRRVIEWTLRRASLEVIAVGDGQAALDRLRLGGVDFLITDQQMPKLLGTDLLAAVKDEALISPNRSILCTAKGFELDVDGLREQFDLTAVFSKPFSPKELVTMVNQALAKVSRTDGPSVAAPAIDRADQADAANLTATRTA